MKVTIDRIEGGIAVVITDNGESFSVPEKLFEGAKEGDIFEITRDEEETKARKARIEKLADKLWK